MKNKERSPTDEHLENILKMSRSNDPNYDELVSSERSDVSH